MLLLAYYAQNYTSIIGASLIIAILVSIGIGSTSYLKNYKFQKEVGVDIIYMLQKVRKQAQKCYN